jgi:hypothetical protein
MPRLEIDADRLPRQFDREPFGYRHNLQSLDIFTPESLAELVARFRSHPKDYFVAAGARNAGTEFFAVEHGQFDPQEALRRLDSTGLRILLKRPENHHSGFRRLLDTLFDQVIALRGGLKGERIVRLESAVFITSASSITPFHFDPEIAFFAQIEGEKIYHVYSPSCVSEAELENFYRCGIVSIAQVELGRRDPGAEHVFALSPGKGLHQPQNSPHWVETRASRSVSYSFVFETDASRARGRTLACNYYLRRAGMSPRSPGASVAGDAMKSGAMRVLQPLRQLRSVVRRTRA